MTLRTIVAAFAAAAVFAAAAHAGAEPSDTTERNLEWILALFGLTQIPDAEATVHHNGDVYTTSAASALRVSAERFGGVDAAALVSSAAEPVGDGPYGVGDVWLLEHGVGTGCGPADFETLAFSPVPATRLHPQAATYSGRLGAGSTGNNANTILAQGYVFDWTTKMTTGGEYRSGYAVFAGQSDFYCVNLGFGYYFIFPFIDGVVQHVENARGG